MAFAAAPLMQDTRRRSLVAGAAGLLLLVGVLELPSARWPDPAAGVRPGPAVVPVAATSASLLQRHLDPVAVEAVEETPAASRSADCAQLADFRALGARDPEALAAAIEPVLGSAEPGRQAALLRALYETGSRRSAQAFLRAIRSSASPAGQEVATFAVRFLARRAARDSAARAILREAAFEQPQPDAAIGRWAAARFAATASPQELWLLPQAVARSGDPLLADGVASALAENAAQDAAQPVLYALGRPAPSVGAGR